MLLQSSNISRFQSLDELTGLHISEHGNRSGIHLRIGKQALWMKHIPKDISDPIFEEIEDDLYMETLLPLMKNKYKTIKAKNDYERSMKLIRFALGRGYSMEVIHKCIDRMKEEDLGDIDFEEEF